MKNKATNQTCGKSKVMSVHLNNSGHSHQLLGFHFGKKSVNKGKIEESRERERSRRISTGSVLIDNIQTKGGSRTSASSLNTSLCN